MAPTHIDINPRASSIRHNKGNDQFYQIASLFHRLNVESRKHDSAIDSAVLTTTSDLSLRKFGAKGRHPRIERGFHSLQKPLLRQIHLPRLPVGQPFSRFRKAPIRSTAVSSCSIPVA